MTPQTKETIEHAIKNIMSDNAFNELKLEKFQKVAKEIVEWISDYYHVIPND